MSHIARFRNVFGELQKDSIYSGFNCTTSAWDGPLIAVNSKHVALIIASHGPGAVVVLPFDAPQRFTSFSTIRGHSSGIQDIAFDPFDEDVIATAGEDGFVRFFRIPEGGFDTMTAENAFASVQHDRKVGTIAFHPSAKNIVSTAGHDGVRTWNLDDCSLVSHTQTPDFVNSISFNKDGSLLAASSKDKHLRIINPRTGEIVSETIAHDGSKTFKALWCTDVDRVVTSGFGRPVGREIKVWNPSDLASPLQVYPLDQASGLFLLGYDQDTSMLYVTGKGEGIIRYFDIMSDAPHIRPLSEYVTNVPTRGIALLPKRNLNCFKNELARVYKLTSQAVEPVSFVCPRRAVGMDKDIYPPAFAGVPALTAAQWISGANSDPVVGELSEDGLVGASKPVVRQEFKKVAEPVKSKPVVEEVVQPIVEEKKINPEIFDSSDSEDEPVVQQKQVVESTPVEKVAQPVVQPVVEEKNVEAVVAELSVVFENKMQEALKHQADEFDVKLCNALKEQGEMYQQLLAAAIDDTKMTLENHFNSLLAQVLTAQAEDAADANRQEEEAVQESGEQEVQEEEKEQ
ncbi:hypothetical protein RCL1_004673 [Eukaryota sp. TZLM3-RCL]